MTKQLSKQPVADGANRLRRSQNLLNSPISAKEDKKPEVATTRDGSGEKEIDGPDGPDPTRFGDWERNGRCIDF